jgi:Fur family ferric uptake transcriptional regulator
MTTITIITATEVTPIRTITPMGIRMTIEVRRTTRQRSAVQQILDSSSEFRSAQEVHAELAQQGVAVGLTTVYRALQTLAADGDVDVLVREDGEAAYRKCGGPHHHHHLVCRACGRTVEVEGPAVERWAASVSEANGFRDVSHTLELFGRCPDC